MGSFPLLFFSILAKIQNAKIYFPMTFDIDSFTLSHYPILNLSKSKYTMYFLKLLVLYFISWSYFIPWSLMPSCTAVLTQFSFFTDSSFLKGSLLSFLFTNAVRISLNNSSHPFGTSYSRLFLIFRGKIAPRFYVNLSTGK